MIKYKVRIMQHRNQFQIVNKTYEISSLPINWDDQTEDEKAEFLYLHGKCVAKDAEPVDYDSEVSEEVIIVQPVIAENVASLQESLKHAIDVFQAILTEINSGTYDAEAAQRDVENLETEGIDVMSVLQDVANG